MTREEFFNRMLALYAFDASLFEDAGAGMYNLDLYETDGVIFDYPLQQTIVQIYFYDNFEGLIYYVCYYKNDYDNWDNECFEPNEHLFDTLFKNILKEYKLNFEIKNNILTFAYKKNTNDMERKLYNVQINVDAYLNFPVVARNENEAVDMAQNIFTGMTTDEIRRKLNDVSLIDTTYAEKVGNIETENYNGRQWEVYPWLHTPNTPICGYTHHEMDDKEDWYVMDTPKGELWMNNCDGYMFILAKNEQKTYIALI